MLDLSNVAGLETNNGEVEIHENQLFGYLVWYTIFEADISRDDLQNRLLSHGLEKFMPKEISPNDAFRRGTSSIEQKNVEEFSSQDVIVNFLVRDVFNDKDQIVRHLVVERVDRKNKELSYDPEMAIIKFDKNNKSISYTSSSCTASKLAEKAKENYSHCLTHYNSRHIREMVYNILASTRPLPVRPSGGVYFVPKEHESTLNSLISVVKSIGDSEVFKIPLVNSAEAKDMVRYNLQKHIENTIQSAANFLLSGTENKAEGNKRLEEIKRVLNGFKSYQELLSLSMAEIKEMTEILQKQAMAVVNRITEIKSAAAS